MMTCPFRAINATVKCKLLAITTYLFTKLPYSISGTALHACGVATDLLLQQCINVNAAFVVCPCCYGYIQDTHTVTYPRSETFKLANITMQVSDVIIMECK